jgi:hypothetical protein
MASTFRVSHTVRSCANILLPAAINISSGNEIVDVAHYIVLTSIARPTYRTISFCEDGEYNRRATDDNHLYYSTH